MQYTSDVSATINGSRGSIQLQIIAAPSRATYHLQATDNLNINPATVSVVNGDDTAGWSTQLEPNVSQPSGDSLTLTVTNTTGVDQPGEAGSVTGTLSGKVAPAFGSTQDISVSGTWVCAVSADDNRQPVGTK